jgi:AraC-like DNA-binding protein
MAVSTATKPPRARLIAQGAGWSACEFVCDAGPDDHAFEERHVGVSIAYVRAGCFRYRTHTGDSLLYPGAFLLGASGRCFECGHEHGVGDRCFSFNFDDAYFDEIAYGASAKPGFIFDRASLPPSPAMQRLAANFETMDAAPAAEIESLALRLALAAVEFCVGHPSVPGSVSERDRRRVAKTLRLIEEDPSAELDLDTLAHVANLSKFHFLRVFARATGQSPHRYLLGVRLRRAAQAIARERRPITEIAYESGFGDLSNFNARFKAAYGVAPQQWRSRH